MTLTRLKDAARKPGVAPGAAAGCLVAAAVAGFAFGAQSGPPLNSADLNLSRQAVLAAADGSNARLQLLKASYDPSLRELAERHDPIAHPRLWGRSQAWASYDMSRAPSLGLGVITVGGARPPSPSSSRPRPPPSAPARSAA